MTRFGGDTNEKTHNPRITKFSSYHAQKSLNFKVDRAPARAAGPPPRPPAEATRTVRKTKSTSAAQNDTRWPPPAAASMPWTATSIRSRQHRRARPVPPAKQQRVRASRLVQLVEWRLRRRSRA